MYICPYSSSLPAGVNSKHIGDGSKSPPHLRPEESVDRSMQSGVQYPSPDIASTSSEEGYDEDAEDGLRQEMMSVLLPYLQTSVEGVPGSAEGGADFHENNVIVEGKQTDLPISFSKRFNKRLNMHAPPEEPIAPHDLEGRNTSSKVPPSQLNITGDSMTHMDTPHQGGILDATPRPSRSPFASPDNFMAVSNPETVGYAGAGALFPYGGLGFSQEPHHNGNVDPESAEILQTESTKREEMPTRDLLQDHGMDGISRPEHPMSSVVGNALASFSPFVFKISNLDPSSEENSTGSISDPENPAAAFPVKSTTVDPVLFSQRNVQREDFLGNTEQQPQTLRAGSRQFSSTEAPLQPQLVSEVPWSTKFDPDLSSSSGDPQSRLTEHTYQFPVFYSTTSDSAEAAMPIVGDANNLGGTPLSNDAGNALGTTPTTLVTDDFTGYFSRKPWLRHVSSSTRKLTSK